MKRPLVLVVLAALAVACGGSHSQRRTDWRSPPQTCASDDDCHGGKCAIEIGASQGTCSGGSLPPLPPAQTADGGAPPAGPPPSFQPSSSDIHL